jgi:DnaJ-class molecular chaperone
MEKINRAYFCLEDEDRRRRYDTYGERGVGTSAASEEQLSKMGGPDAGFGGMGGGGKSWAYCFFTVLFVKSVSNFRS